MESIFYPKDADFHHRDMLKNPHLPGLEMDDNTPLMEAGIDSLSAVEFRNKAQRGRDFLPDFDFLPLQKRMSGLKYIIYPYISIISIG